MRFVHIGDVHLDSGFSAREERVRRTLREAVRTAFRRAVDLAIDERVDAFLIAGDLFDGERLSFQTETFLKEQLGRLVGSEIDVIYGTGNHDPGRSGLRVHDVDWAEGVVVVRDAAPVTTEITRNGQLIARVVAAGHATTNEAADLATSFPASADDVPTVGLLHTQVVGARDEAAHAPYAPAELHRLRRAGYSYWALGHIHLRQGLSQDPAVWYCGNPQGLSPKETGARGCLLVDLAEPAAPRVTFHELAPIRWERLSVENLQEARQLSDVVTAVRHTWEAARVDDSGAGCDWLVRVQLIGACPLHAQLAAEDERLVLSDEIRMDLGVLDVEVRAADLHAPVNPEEHRDRQDVLGEALRLVAAAREDLSRLEDLDLPPLAGGDPQDRAYLTRLLDGIDGELVARMFKGAERS